MKLDTDKLKEIYGESILYDIKENLEDITDNMNYLKTKKFTDIYDIFEKNPYLFFNTPDIFQNKVNNLIEKLGVDYIEKLDNNYNLWGEVDD